MEECMATISPEIRALTESMIALRRDLRRHPELALQEMRTAGIVAERLKSLGYTVRTGLGKTGVTGLLRGGKPGKTVLLRADMDALPIHEETDVPWRSESPGVMHACGHDAHTAMGLTAAAVLARMAPSLAGSVLFMFQPAEEISRGAEAMLRDGALEGIQPDAALAVHVYNEWPAGTIAIGDGPTTASADRLTLTVTGRGGHGASPHLAIDPVVASAQIITALQTLVSRETPPLDAAILSITMLRAGTAFNIIPDTVEMTGTFRCLVPALRERLLASLARTVEGVAAAFRCTAGVKDEYLTPAVVNDPAVTRLARDVAAGIVGAERVITPTPLTGSEDAAYFWEKVPGCYAFIGSARPEWSPAPSLHNARFDLDESCLQVGAEFLVRTACRVLAGNEASRSG
jgi:amidohydrolase